MSPAVESLKQRLISNIRAISEDVQLKLGDKAILELELRHLCTGKHPNVVKAELDAREITLC